MLWLSTGLSQSTRKSTVKCTNSVTYRVTSPKLQKTFSHLVVLVVVWDTPLLDFWLQPNIMQLNRIKFVVVTELKKKKKKKKTFLFRSMSFCNHCLHYSGWSTDFTVKHFHWVYFFGRKQFHKQRDVNILKHKKNNNIYLKTWENNTKTICIRLHTTGKWENVFWMNHTFILSSTVILFQHPF